MLTVDRLELVRDLLIKLVIIPRALSKQRNINLVVLEKLPFFRGVCYFGRKTFGTGYSSLSYLAQYPFDTLKIDRCFISNIAHGCTNAAIVKAIIEMAHSLCLEVIAEGVETEAEKDFLWRYKCDTMQGYLFSPPLPAGDFEQLLVAGK